MDAMTTLHLNDITARQNRAVLMQFMMSLREHAQRRAARKALLKLDDHMLRDIGVTREQVLHNQF